MKQWAGGASVARGFYSSTSYSNLSGFSYFHIKAQHVGTTPDLTVLGIH